MKRQWLIDLRKKSGLSRYAISKKIEITPTYYGLIENGERRPSVDVAKKIAALMGFEDEWFKLLEG